MTRWARWIVLLLSLCAGIASAAERRPPDPLQDELMLRGEFLRAHPDLQYRIFAMDALQRGRAEEALRLFKRAARYADKASQAMVAELLWEGRGVDADRAQAYVWMDMAAERGYPAFLVTRERYWEALSAQEREAAADSGRTVYAEYGDKVARPRMAAVLRRAQHSVTGSRLGQVGHMVINVAGPGVAPTQIEGSRFYEPTFWEPDLYQAWHDSIWGRPAGARIADQAPRAGVP